MQKLKAPVFVISLSWISPTSLSVDKHKTCVAHNLHNERWQPRYSVGPEMLSNFTELHFLYL